MYKNSIKLTILFCFSFLLALMIASGQVSAPRILDLNNGEENIIILGDDADDWSGYSVSSGDINRDGYDDVIIGAPEADPAGETYVIFGSSVTPATIDLNSTSADITIYGDDAGFRFGWSVSSGDINGDSFDDVIIGAPYVNSGETYVIFGSASSPAAIDLNSASADMTIYGDDFGDWSGWSVSSGDINGDGFDDVIIGAPQADPAGGSRAGETYIIFGSSSPPATIDLNSTSADMTIYGDDENDLSGWSVSSGDINGDGFDDVIIGAPDQPPNPYAGESYVIFGSTTPPTTIYLNDSPSPADMILYGDDSGDWSGWSVYSGDINGDGYDDVIIGAPKAWVDPSGSPNVGMTYVIFGSTTPPTTLDLNDSPSSAYMIILGDDYADCSGSSVSSGDINGDGYDDVIIGASHAGPAFGNYAGETYVIYGGASLAATIDLNSTSADITIYGDDEDSESGFAVSSGDINGDGCADVITSAPYANPAGGDEAGETYVIFGSGIPLEYYFTDTDIKDWQRIGTGTAKVKYGQLLLKNTSSYLRIFPKTAVGDECVIEVKVNRKGGNYSRVSSSIFFSYQNKKNYWELKMHLNAARAKVKGEWILQHRKNGVFVEKHSVVDTINRNQQYSIKVVVRENLITVYVDDVKKIEQTIFEKPVWAAIALAYAGAGNSRFDDLIIDRYGGSTQIDPPSLQ